MITFPIVNKRKSCSLHHFRSLMLWKSIMHRSARGNPVEIEVQQRCNRAKNLGLISGHPADPAARLPPPRHMLPHLLTLTRAAVPGLILIHPDSHLLGIRPKFAFFLHHFRSLMLWKSTNDHVYNSKTAKIIHFASFAFTYALKIDKWSLLQ